MRGTVSVLRGLLDAVCSAVFVRRCPGCGARISSGALCEDCLRSFRMSAMTLCPTCRQPIPSCRCTVLDGGALVVYSLLAYRPGQSGIAERLLIARKAHLMPAIEDYLAHLTAPLCSCAIAECGGERDEWLLTYPPRSRKKRRTVGHDQSRELARRLSALTGAPMIPCLVRSGNADTVQKMLDAAKRTENAENTYRLARRYQTKLRGRSVILIDDIATTGATLAACASILKEAGAVRVIALTAAKTVHGKADGQSSRITV